MRISGFGEIFVSCRKKCASHVCSWLADFALSGEIEIDVVHNALTLVETADGKTVFSLACGGSPFSFVSDH